jgi:glycosyltransferase
MKFTIAIPTYKRENLLQKAIISAKNQKTNVEYEILVIDNDPDSTIEYLMPEIVNNASCQIRYIKNETNIGMFGNWNKCIDLAQGQWITMLSDDDLLHEYYLDTIERYLDIQISCISVEKKDFQIDNDLKIGEKHNKYRAFKINKKIFNYFNPIGTPTGFAFKKEYAIKIGGYDQNFYPSSDYLFAKKITQYGDLIKIKGVYGFTGIGVNESINVKTLKLFYLRDLDIRNIRPMYLNKVIGVLNVVEQARKFSIKPSKLFNNMRIFDIPLQAISLLFRVIKYFMIKLNSKAI